MNSVRRILKTPRSTIKSLTRQIDIQTSQPLRNIAERRCLLDALQKFGEVTTFLPGKDGDKSKISAIYETPEAASKAVDASPLTVLLPTHSLLSTPSRADTRVHEPIVDINVTCAINPAITAITTTENEERICKNPWNNLHTGYTWDKNNPAIKNDTRIQDVIAAGAPRGVFADGVIDASYLRSGKDETANKRMDGRTKTTVELKGSLLALLEE